MASFNHNYVCFLTYFAKNVSVKSFVGWSFSSDAKWFLLLSVWISLISLSFLTSSRVFSKAALFINFKKYFSKWFLFCFFLRSVFASIQCFGQAFWLNSIILWTNLWFNACFELLMCITWSILSCKLAKKYWNFSISIFSGENSKSLWSLFNFSWCSTLFSRKYPSSISWL